MATKSTKKFKIAGNALIITSKLQLDTVLKMEKFNKDLLCLAETKNDEIRELFRISAGKVSTLSKYGITFAAKDKDGNATATILLPDNVAYDKRVEYVKETYGSALLMLAELEDAIATAAAEIEAAYNKLNEEIEEV